MAIEISSDRPGEYEDRFVICYTIVLIFFAVVFLRLFYLQIIRGRHFELFSQSYTMKEIRKPATRGVIFDRNGIPIAESRPSFEVALVAQHVRDIEKVKKGLKQIAGIDPAVVDQTWKAQGRFPSYYPMTVASDVTYDQAVKIRSAQVVEYTPEEGIDLQGVEVIVRPLRSYPQGPIASTMLGYIGEISEKDLARYEKEEPGRYNPGDFTGASGLERYWEKYLQGQDGYEQRIVDAVGREIQLEDLESLLTRREAEHGDNLHLTIDSRLQKFAEERFQGKSGSLVALDPRNGEILAMVSLPSYDPSKMVANVSHEHWTSIVTDPRRLLLNRAVQGSYPPGSTFKIVTAIAALEEGMIKPQEHIVCSGGLRYGNRFFKCWNKSGHGPISIHDAIASSCDTFFYQMGLRLGVDRLAKYAHLFGMGSKTGVDLDGEKSGTIATSEWKKRVFHEDWQAGENLSIAVGQGYDAVTPLQNALMVAEVATGRKLKPHLLKMIQSDDGHVVRQPEWTEEDRLPISEETLRLVRAGMLDVVESSIGTAKGSRSAKFKMAGKTGTAQVISEEGKARAHGINTADHAWFIAYAPYDDPKIAVNVLVEHGGFGASAAAPIAKDVIEKYLEEEASP